MFKSDGNVIHFSAPKGESTSFPPVWWTIERLEESTTVVLSKRLDSISHGLQFYAPNF